MSKIKTISTSNAPAAIGPYSQAVVAGKLLFASGQIPIDPATGKVESEKVEEQAHAVFKNIGAILGAAGLTYSDVVKTTVFLTDINDFAAVNEIYAKYFTSPFPARSCVQVAALPKGVKIETEIVAELD